jgi:hypothetical protein
MFLKSFKTLWRVYVFLAGVFLFTGVLAYNVHNPFG